MNKKTQLHDIMVSRIRSAGRITFAEFMAACLYEPGHGYYTSPGRKVGAEGDFYTSITVHAAYGRVIAREICRMWLEMGSPGEFTLVECGAGNGRLAADIMDYIARREPGFYKTVSMVLVEKEPSLGYAQREVLNAHLDHVRWLSPDEFESGSFRFTGCLYSNELMDAMPVHRVAMGEAELRELYVTIRDNELAEELGPLSTPAIADYLRRIGITLHPGQHAEVNLAMVSWLETAAHALERGFLLTVDYGHPAQELYAPSRKHGTLLCYHKHQLEDNPYIRLGRQDITSHVDFTTLSVRGSELGLKPVWFGEQYRFLLSVGIVEEMEEIERSSVSEPEKLKLRLALKKLIMPEGGMGDTFKVLVQSKGLDNPKLLCLRGIGF